MNHNFKPGDLALSLVERCGVPAMTQFELVDLVPAGTGMRCAAGDLHRFPMDVWRCGTPLVADGCLIFEAKELMPLRGDFTPERQKSQEVPA